MLQKVCQILISDIGLVISWLMVTPKNYVKMCTSVGSAALGSSPLKLSSPAMEYLCMRHTEAKTNRNNSIISGMEKNNVMGPNSKCFLSV